MRRYKILYAAALCIMLGSSVLASETEVKKYPSLTVEVGDSKIEEPKVEEPKVEEPKVQEPTVEDTIHEYIENSESYDEDMKGHTIEGIFQKLQNKLMVIVQGGATLTETIILIGGLVSIVLILLGAVFRSKKLMSGACIGLIIELIVYGIVTNYDVFFATGVQLLTN